MNERLKSLLVIAAMVALFVAGILRYGVPPVRLADKAPRDAAAATTSTAITAGILTITHSNGPPEDDRPAQEERRLLARLFHEKQPDAQIRYSTWQFSPDSFFAKSVAGTLPEVIGVFATEATMVIDKGMAADITPELRAWKLYPMMNPKLVEPISRGGKVFGLPVGGANGGFYVMTLFYNADMLRAAGLTGPGGEVIPPQTWDDFTTYARRLTDRGRGVAGFGILGETGGSGWHFLNWVWQAGGDFERRDAQGRWISTFHEPPAVRALRFIHDLRWKHDVLQRNVLAVNDELCEMFAAGRIAMCFQAPETVQTLVYKYRMPIGRVGICLLPAGPAGRANQIGGAFTLLNPRLTGKTKQRAFDSIAFEHDPDVAEQRLALLARQKRPVGIPAVPVFLPEYQRRLDAIVNKYRNVPDQSALMAQAADAVRLEPPIRCQALYNLYLGPCVQEALVDHEADPERLLRDASRRFQIRELDPVNRELEKKAAAAK